MPTVLRRSEVLFIDTPGHNQAGALATPSRGATAVSIIVQRQIPGGVSPLHSHDREEVTLLAAGRVAMTVGDERVEIGPGDAVVVPPRTLHRMVNAGETAAEWLIVAPAGVRFFAEDGAEAEPDWAR